MRALLVALAVAMSGGSGASAQAPRAAGPLLVAVVYRGTPAGTPRMEDLSAIRGLGFTAVVWPQADPVQRAELDRLAAPLDLAVVVKADATVPVTASTPDLPALAWRAVARGARVVAFDPRAKTGTGLANASGERLPWARTASEFAARIAASARLFAIAKPGPAVTWVGPAPKGLEAALLDGGRAWLLIATHTGSSEARAVARLPPRVPYALWLSLIDGDMLSMLHEAGGPRWTFTIGAGEARVYVIDKSPRMNLEAW
jgi:hypothetical protein